MPHRLTAAFEWWHSMDPALWDGAGATLATDQSNGSGQFRWSPASQGVSNGSPAASAAPLATQSGMRRHSAAPSAPASRPSSKLGVCLVFLGAGVPRLPHAPAPRPPDMLHQSCGDRHGWRPAECGKKTRCSVQQARVTVGPPNQEDCRSPGKGGARLALEGAFVPPAKLLTTGAGPGMDKIGSSLCAQADDAANAGPLGASQQEDGRAPTCTRVAKRRDSTRVLLSG